MSTPLPHPGAFSLSDEAVERALRTGDHAGLLEDYFGPEQYAELRQLAREAAARSTRGGPRVLILPGIMGSKIGVRGRIALFDDVLWIDPIDIARGRLRALALPATAATRRLGALGVVLFTYLRIKLRLQRAGYDADFHPFDWRRSIAELGAELATRITKENRTQPRGLRVSLVAHSMGGLVARWALGRGGAECQRLVMLGTPNHGSFAPVMALRAVYPVVRKVAWLDRRNTPEQLAVDVFSTFPGLTEMLPSPERWSALDLYDLDNWPADELRPRAEILRNVATMRAGLAAGGSDFHLVAGVDHETVTGITATAASGFEYVSSRDGDGTVPLDFARLDPIGGTYYVAEAHGSLPNNRRVGDAVIELLERGSTELLATTHAPAVRAVTTAIPESALRVDPYPAERAALSQRDLRALIAEVAAPDARDEAVAVSPLTTPAVAAPAGAAAPAGIGGVVVGRRRQRLLDIRLAHGSITEVDARALALGIFRDVAPSGPAIAIDRRLNGAVTELTRRRMFAANVGEIFMLPTGRHPIAAEFIAFLGLGAFDRFDNDVIETAAENAVRTFVQARVDELATVVLGGGTAHHLGDVLESLLTGFLRGLRDADRDRSFRRLVICEYDAARFARIRDELYRLAGTPLCDDFELSFDEIVLPPELARDAAPTRAVAARRSVYLIARREHAANVETPDVRSSLLTVGTKATVITGTRPFDAAAFEALRARIVAQRSPDFARVGSELAALILAPEIREVLPRFREDHLVVVHDAALARVPWETIAFDTGDGVWHPAADAGLTHRYAAENLSVAKWLEQRVDDATLNVLVVVDPTSDLEGAVEEGERIVAMLSGQPSCETVVIRQSEATRPRLLSEFASGRYDVVHYAGHAFFDERAPERSGLLLAGRAVLSGADLAGIGSLPTLVFFNACESGRLRAEPTADRVRRVDEAVGLAEAFMRGGVANFLGTYWPVGDEAAARFAADFYGALVAGIPINDALQQGRATLLAMPSRDWADYVFYGDPDFALKP
jgi:CHAT domain-containing protein